MKNTMKKTLMLVAVLVTVVMSLAVFAGANWEEDIDPITDLAATGQCGYSSYWTFDKSTGTLVVSGTGKMTSGSFMKQKGIKTVIIGEGITNVEGFNECVNMTSISIPNSVTEIGWFAFSDCKSLKSITIPANVSEITRFSFIRCESLESINVSASNPYFSSDSYGVLFNKDKTELIEYPQGNKRTSYIIPNSVTKIADSAFAECGYLENIEIPDSVTSIGESAFEYCVNLKGIELPDGITSISESALYFCESLEEASIPDSVTIIEPLAFSGCSSLKEITIPESVTSIGYGAFRVTGISSITIPDGITCINNSMFYSCENLVSIAIPDSVTSIGDSAFKCCSKLENITIPEYVTSIGESAFDECTSLKSIIIPDSVTSIGDYIFRYCSSLADVVIGNGVTSIGKDAFAACFGIRSLKIGNGVTSIPNRCFSLLTNLRTLVIGNSVESIGDYAFSNSTKLRNVWVPVSVTYIGVYAFDLEDDFEKVHYAGTQEQWEQITHEVGGLRYEDIHYLCSGDDVPDSSEEDEPNKCGKNVTFELNDDGSVVISGTGAMYDYSDYDRSPFYGKKITSVTIGDGITKIGDYAFDSCEELKEVKIGKDVTSIGESAFQYAEGLTSIIIPDSVNEIGDSAFFNCLGLKNVTIGSGTTNIGNSAFTFCQRLERITVASDNPEYASDSHGALFDKEKTILYVYPAANKSESYTVPGSVVSIEFGAFVFNEYIKNITLPEGLRYIGNYAFELCRSLTSIKIPASVTEIGQYVFSNCDSLTGITVDANNQNYSSDACGVLFDKAKILLIQYPNGRVSDTYVVPDSVLVIGGYMSFHGREGLETIVIPTSVTEIEYKAFAYCESLKSVHYMGTEEQWKEIYVDSENGCLMNAAFHFECTGDDIAKPVVLGKTSSLTATQSTSAVKLTWSAVDGANIYRVYQKNGSSWKKLGDVAKLNGYIGNLKAGTKYTFAVKAGRTENGKTEWATTFATISTATKNKAPSKVASAQNTGAIKLSWTATAGADGYRVYYKSGSTWKALKTTTATSHTISNLKAGAKYTFAIQPYIKTGSGVVWGEYAEYTAATTPATVTAKATSTAKGKVALSWNAVNGSDGYQVYYKTGNGSYKLYKTYSKAGTLNFSNLKSGTKYTFVVRAGIKTSGGNIYGAYKAAAVTVK